ncbi:E3 ubiquitin-protein ligase listerin-like [Polyodon spathula]|uniref:E3 ubiquitin-protein ligase listerin-like n=1 Tax=Polyodon spathula TaxID=7913 RepID=UPI001B7EAAC4|nr:E3 ubiquitin-protein ligase listerin-like [Polyodon spathula]
MGGKNKQRTKGNVRPSSSGRAAELLARERGAVPGFVGFGSSSHDLGYVPAVYGTDEMDNLVDADFRMVLRKLSKRDTITKLKAVQEFGTMCTERESEIVKGVLPYWPRIYCKISMDHDRRVREATGQAFEQLILKVKRNLAPYLKSIMGYWLIAQCDTYSPVASAANVAFQAAFPTSKQPEALAFCKEEILNILQDNLLKETPETLSDPQSVPEEEREAKYVRVVTCSLLALKKLLTLLPGPEIDTLEENLTQLISQNKFWKYSKHTTPQIRGALFEEVATFCQRTPELIQTQATRACSAVLLNIDDTDPVVCPALWEAVLYILTNIKKDTDFLVNMLYSVLHCCDSNEEKRRILDHISKMDLKWSTLLQIIHKACADEAKFEATSDWLKGEVLGEKLVKLAEDLCAIGLNRISTLESSHSDSWALISLELSQHVQKHSLLQKLNNACFAGIQSLVGQIGTDFGEGTFLHSSALWVKNQILNSTVGVKSLQVLISSVCSLVENLIKTNPPSSHIMEKFVECLTPSDSEWKMMRQALPPQWLKRPLLNGRLSLNCQYHCMDVWRFRSSVKIPSHLCAAALLGQVILIMLESESINEVDKLNLVGAECTVVEVLYSLQWCEEIEVLPAVVSEFFGMLQEMNITNERISKESGKLFNVLETLFSRSMQSGSLWTLTLAKYPETKAVSSSDLKKLYGTIESFFPLTEQNLCTIQGLSPFLFKEEKELLMNYCTAELLKWEDTDITSIHGGYGHLAVIHCCLKSGATGDQEMLMEVLRTVMEWRNLKEDVFLFNFNLKEASPSLLVFNVQIIRFICWLIRRSPPFMTDSQWDFILCSMLAWLESASENTTSYWNPWAQVFVCQTCNLVTALSEFFTGPAPDLLEKLPVNLMSEWKEFFTEGVHSLLLPLFVKITEEFSETDDPLFPLPVLKAVGDALTYIPVQQLTQNNLQPKFVAGQKTNLPDKLQTLLNTITPLLLFKARHVQISVYYILHKVMPQLPEFDNENDNTKSDDEEEEEPCLSPPAALMAILGATEELLDDILGSVQVGEFAVVQPLSEEYCCILGYLLTWKLILTFFKASSSHLRVQYSHYLRKTKCLHKLLFHLFRLMPDNPVYPGQTAEPGSKETRTFFTEDLHLSVLKTEYLPSEIAHLACSVYYITLKDLPAMVRLWWKGQEKRVFNTVDKFTSKYVSNVLSCQEISSVQTSTQTFENMTVKARSTTREVIATYSVEDIFIELVVQLPQNYPLGSISVESGRRVGIAVQQWRNWMLQLSTYLTHQNGSIMEGLALWKNNVDKRFEGVEDCMICYSVIHGSNYSLPKFSDFILTTVISQCRASGLSLNLWLSLAPRVYRPFSFILQFAR